LPPLSHGPWSREKSLLQLSPLPRGKPLRVYSVKRCRRSGLLGRRNIADDADRAPAVQSSRQTSCIFASVRFRPAPPILTVLQQGSWRLGVHNGHHHGYSVSTSGFLNGSRSLRWGITARPYIVHMRKTPKSLCHHLKIAKGLWQQPKSSRYRCVSPSWLSPPHAIGYAV
jgi:hypothetical protein